MSKKSTQEPAIKKAMRMNSLKDFLSMAIIFLVFLLVWELLVSILDVPRYILPAPSVAIVAFFQYWTAMVPHMMATLSVIIIGFGLTILISIPAATMVAYSKTFERLIYPFLVLLQLIPKVAIAPLFIIWFGFGTLPKVMLVFLLSFFPLFIDATVGFKSLNPRLIYVAKTMSHSEWKFFWKIRFPSALPQIFAGLKTSVAFATVGAIVAEFVGSDSGLGYLLMRANGDLNTPFLFALLILLCIIGIVLYKIIEVVESLAIPWHASKRTDLLQVPRNKA